MLPFVHPYMLFGLVLIGVPVLVHLIMRQKPKRLPFPAFRFLAQRHLINRRKIRLQHLLLLLLRMAVIAALCLALARPRLAGGPWVMAERPVAAVFAFDTSPSMEYTTAGVSRLEEAKRRAHELLDEMAEGSRVIVLDSADESAGDSPDWLSPGQVAARLAGLRTRPANAALNRAIEQGLQALAHAGEGEEPPPRFLYVFSDRTQACWDRSALKPQRPEGVSAVFVDVGVDSPRDLAIDALEIDPPVAAPGAKVQVRVTVRATGTEYDTELTCRLEGEADPAAATERRPLRLAPGQSQVVTFERTAPRPPGGGAEGPCQVTASVLTQDALAFNNVRHATFLIRERRKVLTVVDRAAPAGDVPPWRGWEVALEAVGAFQNEVRTLDELARLDDKELRAYPVVCLFQAATPAELWPKLTRYVTAGGGLVVVPGGEEWRPVREAVNREGKDLLPLALRTITQVPAGDKAVPWVNVAAEHPIPRFFQQSIRTGSPDYGQPAVRPRVYAYWQGEKLGDAVVLAAFADDKRGAALAERSVGRGHVLELTTPLDFRPLDAVRRWHNYWQDSSFGVVLVDQLCRYLAGDAVAVQLNYRCGQAVELPVPPLTPPFTLQGPGLVRAEANLNPPRAGGRLAVPQAASAGPGNFTVVDARDRLAAAFSLNVPAAESNLERVPKEDIESVLGENALLQVGRAVSLKEALQSGRPPPVELLPWLMMAVLAFLTLEGLFANLFYRLTQSAAEPERIAP
jgi:hypothetical protein